MRYRFRFALSLLLLHILAGTSFAATQEEVKSAIGSRYKLTVPGFLGGFKEVGTVLVVQKEGLRANRLSASFKAPCFDNKLCYFMLCLRSKEETKNERFPYPPT